jgi:drug/metabolite transporter (DMT)-like permease
MRAFRVSKPILVSLTVCIGCFVVAAGIGAVAPHCVGHTECTLERSPYVIPAIGFGVVGVFIALFLFCYGITWGLDRLDEWKNKSKTS